MSLERQQTSFADDLIARLYRPRPLSAGAQALLQAFRARTEKVTQADLAAELHTSAVTIRKQIRELRRAGWLVCTDGDGCWLTGDRGEIERTIKSLSGRELSILSTVAAMKKHLEEL